MSAALDYTSSILIEDYVNKKADEVIDNRFDDLAVFINENGNANIYDKHFKAMMNGEEKAKENAYKFMFN